MRNRLFNEAGLENEAENLAPPAYAALPFDERLHNTNFAILRRNADTKKNLNQLIMEFDASLKEYQQHLCVEVFNVMHAKNIVYADMQALYDAVYASSYVIDEYEDNGERWYERREFIDFDGVLMRNISELINGAILNDAINFKLDDVILGKKFQIISELRTLLDASENDNPELRLNNFKQLLNTNLEGESITRKEFIAYRRDHQESEYKAAKTLLKIIATGLATIFGLGLGGYYAYQYLFKSRGERIVSKIEDKYDAVPRLMNSHVY